jgi:hypothetical protein
MGRHRRTPASRHQGRTSGGEIPPGQPQCHPASTPSPGGPAGTPSPGGPAGLPLLGGAGSTSPLSVPASTALPANPASTGLPRHRARTGPRGRRSGTLIRRLVITPTFAAGLGVVVAAVLASQAGGPVFNYSSPRWQGSPCGTAGCSPSTPNPGTPATARPGLRLATPPPAKALRSHGSKPHRRKSTTGASAGQPVLAYRTLGHWHGEFLGELMVGFPPGQVPRRWRLAFSYPSGRIFRGWGGGWWLWPEPHSAVVEAGPQPGQRPPATVWLWFLATGRPRPPATCSINNQPCRFR